MERRSTGKAPHQRARQRQGNHRSTCAVRVFPSEPRYAGRAPRCLGRQGSCWRRSGRPPVRGSRTWIRAMALSIKTGMPKRRDDPEPKFDALYRAVNQATAAWSSATSTARQWRRRTRLRRRQRGDSHHDGAGARRCDRRWTGVLPGAPGASGVARCSGPSPEASGQLQSAAGGALSAAMAHGDCRSGPRPRPLSSRRIKDELGRASARPSMDHPADPRRSSVLTTPRAPCVVS